MTTKSPAQIFTEATGGHWHIGREDGFPRFGVCECGYVAINKNTLDNPTYSNPADILRRMKEFLGEEGFEKFIKTISLEKHVDYREAYGEPDERYFVTMSIIDFINGFILNAPALLDKAIEYLQMKGE